MSESITWPSPVQERKVSPGLIPDVSIVIVSWNVRDHLENCLRSIFSKGVLDHLNIEVIVVDNDSSDGSVEAARAFPTRVIVNTENVGYGRANNIGLRAARGRYLCVLNPDTIVHEGALERLINFADKRQKAAIVSSRLLNSDGTVQTGAFRFPTLPMAALDLFPLPGIIPGRLRAMLQNSTLNGRYPDEAQREHPLKIEHPLGAAFLIRRKAFEEYGGFDESIFMYSEEIDMALRYDRAGWEAWQVPAARITHLGGQSTRQMPDSMFVELWRSRLYIYDRYYTLPARYALRGVLLLAMLRTYLLGVFEQLRSGSKEVSESRLTRARSIIRLALGIR